ncbi:MAG: mechanosensitive ion channel [Planctomycetota bacterium]|nr:mechanosensitive ion channel [Planctomycetota bacterium]
MESLKADPFGTLWPYLEGVVFAILIFVIGRIVVKILTGVLRKVMAKAKVDVILINFLVSIAAGVMMLFVIIASLDKLGVPTGSAVALVGAAGLAVGFAMQDSLSNFASGVMLIIFRPFKNGDFIEAGGVTGVVEKIQIFTTIMKTGDNREIIVPNGAIFGGVITNYSARPTRRVDMVFGIGYGDDLLKAKQILTDIIAADDRILKQPAPAIAINDLGDSSVNFKVRPWVNSGDYWDVLSDITETVKLTFDKEGISIPFPQTDVHLHKVD